jgi:hypothetical protein
MNYKLSPDAAGNGSTTSAMVMGSLEMPFLRTSGKLKVISWFESYFVV